MYVGARSGPEVGSSTGYVADSDFEVYWEGLLFFPGVPAGPRSAQELLSTLGSDDTLEMVVQRTLGLRGNWSLFIHSLFDDSWLACADHSHQSYLYHSADAVSSSFLRIRQDVDGDWALSSEALVALLCTGFCHEPTAFYEGLKIVDYRDYVVIKDGVLIIGRKGLPDPFESTRDIGSFLDAIDRLFSSLRDEKISVDLSGGTDSRLLATCLDHLGYEFDIATEGDDSYSEVKTAKAVGALIGKELKYRNLSTDDLRPSDLHDAWVACDGLDLPILSYKFETWRQRQGYTVAVSGFAGELYKDGGWYRIALPSSLPRRGVPALIDRMIGSEDLVTWDGTSYAELYSMLTPEMGTRMREWLARTRERLVAEFEQYSALRASDRVFYEHSVNRPMGTRIASLSHYTPLMEPDLVRIGVNQPIRKRLNHSFHRKECGSLNSAVAALETDRGGLTMSTRLRDQPREWRRYIQYHLASKGIGRAHGAKSENKNASLVREFVLGSDEVRAALDDLRRRGVLRPDFGHPTLGQAKRLLMLHFLLDTRPHSVSGSLSNQRP